MSQLVGLLGKMAGAVTGFAKDSIQSFSNFEQIQNNLSNVMKSAEKGKALFEDLRKFSFDTTFGVDTLASAAQQLLSTGTAADKLKTRLKQLGDVAGGDTNKFNDLVSIMAKIQNTGKASSMQLQQLALRGVPIYQMLSEMGVEGTATSDQIVEAFERMTDAGGQFYNNMQSINETIQGKEGFISDTWREFLTSFAEASGLADMYKSALDGVYGALQGVVDWLQKINENPVTQAIFKGALVAVLGTIAATILGSVIPALVATISKLSIIAALKAAINPVGLAIGAAVAIGTGAIVALGAASDATLETMQGFEPLPDAFEAMAASLEPVTEGLVTAAEAAADMKESLGEDTTNAFQERLDNISNLILQRSEDASGMMRGTLEGRDWRTLDLDSIKKNYQEYYGFDGIQELIDNYNEVEEVARKLYDVTKKESLELEKQAALQETIRANEEMRLSVTEEIAEAYARTQKGQLEALDLEIQKYQTMLKLGGLETITSGTNPTTGQVYTSTQYKWQTPNQKAQVEEILKELLAKRNSKNGTASKSSYTGWWDVFTDVTGINTKSTDNGGKKVEEYIELLDKASASQYKLQKAIYGDSYTKTAQDTLAQERERLQTLYKTLDELWANNDKITTGDKFEEEDNVNKQLRKEIEDQTKKVRQAEIAAKEEEYQNLLDSIKAETELVQLTEQEQKIREYINQGFNETQAKALASAEAEKEGKRQVSEVLKSLRERQEVLGLTGIQLRTQQLIQQGINEEDAKALAIAEKSLDIQERLTKARQTSKAAYKMEKGNIALEHYQETGEWEKGGRSDYVQGQMTNSWLSAVQGTDVGTFAQGIADGKGVFASLIETVLGAIVKIVKNFDSFDKVMNFMTTWLQKLAPLLEFIFDILGMIVDLVSAVLDFLRPLMEVIKMIGKLLKDTVGEWLTNLAEVAEDFVQWFMSWLGIEEEYNAAKQEEVDRLKELNKQYQTLSQAIDEQNQYYLQQKQKINAEAYDRLLGATPVNDLIITKNGMFSTSPDDYIMAMKHPETLGGGNVQMNVKIVNERGSDTDVNVSQGQDENEMIITISKKVASDYAKGVNGWDGAVAYREKRQNGRKVTA